MAAVPKKGRSKGGKALETVCDSDANIIRPDASGLASILSPPRKARSKQVVTKNNAVSGKSSQEATPEDGAVSAKQMQELQVMMQQLRIEKEMAEEKLRDSENMLKEKEEQIVNHGKEHEKLHAEIKKLQKMKEFKPTVSLPLVRSLRENGQEGKENRKKPCVPYILWCREQWNEIKKERPEADFKETTNALGAKWKALSAEEKKPFEEKYQQEKDAYLQIVGQEKREVEAMKLLEEEQMQKTAMQLLEEYLKFKQETDGQETKGRKVKDPSKPKKPMSAFFLFSNERRSALLAEKKSVVEIARITGEEWRSMTEQQKAPYEEIAGRQKEDYKQQMEFYKQKRLEESAALEKEEDEQKKVVKQEALQLLKKKEKTETLIRETKAKRRANKKQKEEEDPNRPKKPASSFLLFSKELRKQLTAERPDMSKSTLSALISVKWKELNEEEKQRWNEAAKESMEAYKRDIVEYNKKSTKVSVS